MRKKIRPFLFFILMVCVAIACKKKHVEDVAEKPDYIAPISIEGLQKRSYNSIITLEKELTHTATYSSKLISYVADSLKIYALVTVPKIEQPKEGFPILIFGHGFHPEPKKYGVSTKTGEDWRPGDYYRGIPEAYAEQGYLVITPDYRGHNISEGYKFTQTSYLASTYYAIDVLHLAASLHQLKEGNPNNVYYLGHSMGGDVGLKVLLANNQIKAASLWAGVSASTREQALYYGKFYDKNNKETTSISMNTYMEKLNKTIANLGFDYDINSGDAINYIQAINTPIILHHGRWETAVPYQWSENLAAKLFQFNKVFQLHTYDSKNHLFKGENRQKAIQKDLEFFRKHKAN